MDSFASRWMRVLGRPTHVALGVVLAGSVAAADQVPNHVFGAGGGVYESRSMRLQYTIGEPLSTTVQAGTTRLIGGFQASFAPKLGDDPDFIFRDGFELSTP